MRVDPETLTKGQLKEAWVQFERTGDPALHWSVFAFDEWCSHKPDQAWEAIQEIFLDHSDDKGVVGMLAAAPLEDLLVRHGEDYWPKVMAFLEVSPRFAECLRGVWLSDGGVAEELRELKMGRGWC